jgi:carboxypeptidase family protein
MNPAGTLQIAALSLLVNSITFGQVTPVSTSTQPPSKTGAIKGRVVAADTGLGLSKATITLLAEEGGNGGEPLVVRTEENGGYEVRTVKAGRYSILASRSGYLSQFYGQKRPSFPYDRTGSTMLHVREGETCSDIDFRLIRHGVIDGRVIDASGEPAPRARVQLSQYRNIEGRRRLVAGGRTLMAETDDRGYFRLFEIPPGAYYLSARRNFFLMRAEGERTATPPTYYPGVLDPQDASRIEVGPGSEIQGIEIPLLEVRGFNVSGQVVFPQDTQNREIDLLARRYGADGSFGNFYENGIVERTGRFTFKNIIPGKYLVTALTENFGPSEPNSRALSGTRELEVTDSDLDEVTIAVGYGGEIHGRMEWPGDSSLVDLRGVYVRVSPDGGFERFSHPQGGELTPGLGFNLKGLSEGRIRLHVWLPPGPHYLKSIRIDGKEVVDQALEIHNNDVLRAVVTIAADGAELAGIAKTQDPEAPAKGVDIVAVAAQAELRLSPRFRRRTQTDQNGRFSLRGLPPGSYLLAAVADLEPSGENDPEFLKGLEKTAQRVELSAGRVYNETLTVTPSVAQR